jgi:hypothetical protein
MKHLKPYKVFEADITTFYDADVVSKCDETIAELKDILLELTDIGYQANVDYAPYLRRYLNYKTPTIQINITKPSEDSEMNAGFRFLPLWNSEDDKMDFDDVILRILYFITGEGYKYEYEGIRSAVEEIKGQIVRYNINIYKQ